MSGAVAAALPAALAAAAVGAAAGLPATGRLRLSAVLPLPHPGRQAARRPHPLVLLALVAAGCWLLGPGIVVLGAAGVAATAVVLRHRRRSRAAALERGRATEACSALAAELRAGRPPAHALSVAAELAVGPSRAVLRGAAATAGLGGDVPTALLVPAGTSSAVPEVLRGLAACWQVCSQAGGGLAASVDRLTQGLRAREAQERAVDTALAGPRSSAALLAVLPLVGVALAAGLGARPGHVLLHTPVGLGCLFAGLTLDLLGLWWTGRIVAHAAGRVS